MSREFVSWEKTRFKYDQINKFENSIPDSTTSRELLYNAVKINEYLSPQITNVVEEIKKVLNLEHRINLYVKSNPTINAYSYSGATGEINMLLTSALVNIMTIDEIKFIVTHECGHVLFEHHKPFRDGLNDESKRFLGNACEISCDRLAHSLVDNPLSSYSALLKIESGLSQDKLNLNVREYLLEYKITNDSKNVFISSQASHPFINTRIKALLLYETSNLYYGIKKYNDPAPSNIERIESKIVDEIIKNGFVRIDLIEKDHHEKLLFWTDFLFLLDNPKNKADFVNKYGIDHFDMGVRTLKKEGIIGINERILEKKEILRNAVYLI